MIHGIEVDSERAQYEATGKEGGSCCRHEKAETEVSRVTERDRTFHGFRECKLKGTAEASGPPAAALAPHALKLDAPKF